MSEDLFLKIIAGEIPSDKVYEDDDIYAFRDINPTAPTHILIVPKKHIRDVDGIQPEDAELMGKILIAASKLAKQEGLTSGYRIVINNGPDAQQSVFHIHFHLIGGRELGWPPG